MDGPDNKPLLVLSREGQGRVALLLSDHIWLWARGYEDGGPHLDLLRRLSHWLMQQPDLEEEALRMFANGHELTVQRQTMADSVSDVTLTSPSGATRTLVLDPVEAGVWRKTFDANEMGLWRATDGKLTALVNHRSRKSARIHRSDIDNRRPGAARQRDGRRCAPARQR